MPSFRALWRSPRGDISRMVSFAILLVVAPLAVLGTTTPATAAPSSPPAEVAGTIASPSVVYLETVYTGLVRDRQTNQPLVDSPVTYFRRCSGFVVNSAGDVVTSMECVSPAEATLRQQMLGIAALKLTSAGKLEAAQQNDWINTHLATAVVTGAANASQPDAKLFAQLDVAKGALTDKPAMTATVVGKSGPKNGDVALVKVDQGNLPAVELAPAAQLAAGTHLTVLGFDTQGTDPQGNTYAVKSHQVQVVEEVKRDNTNVFRLDEKLQGLIIGGVAVDANGRAVGVISNDPSGTPNVRAVTPVSTITPVLDAAGVHNVLNESDKLFRTGLLAYFGGQYRTAISDLDQVARAVPTNHVAATYKQNAVDRQQSNSSSSSGGGTAWLVPVLAALGGILVTLAAGVLFLRMRRPRTREATDWAPPPSYTPSPSIPPGPQSFAPGPPSYAPGPQSYAPGPPSFAPPPFYAPGPSPAPGADPPWVALGPVSAPPTPLPVENATTTDATPQPETPPVVGGEDLFTTQSVSWPPPQAMPDTFAPPAEPALAAQPTPSEATEAPPPPLLPPPLPPLPRPTWQQGPTRRPPALEEQAEADDSPSPWAVPPPSQ